MKNSKKKVLSLILVLLLVGGMLIPAFAFGTKADDTPIFYVDAYSGSDNNNGKSMATPLESINAAIALAGDSDFEVCIIDSHTLPENFAPHKGRMTITGFDSTSKLVTKNHGGYTFGGPVTIKNINFENGLYAWLCLNGNEVIFDKKITTTGDHQIIAGGKFDKTVSSMNVSVSSGDWSQLVLGPIAANPAHTVTGDVQAHITGGKVDTLLVGGAGWNNDHRGVTFESNVLVRIDGGAVETVKSGALRYAPTVKGAFMLICNNETQAKVDKTLSTASVKGGKYYVYSGKGGKVEFVYDANGNSKKGVVLVNPKAGNYAVITNGDNTTRIFDDTEITLSQGTTNITYSKLSEITGVVRVKNGEDEHVFFPQDELDISHGGVVSFPDEGFEKSGHIFAGWYSDAQFTKPVKNGDNISAGKLFARWIPFDTKDLSTLGVQIKLSGGNGLRFVTKIDGALRSQIAVLNGKNSPISPDDASFNGTADIGYGTVILPEEYLSESELKKDTAYPVGDVKYVAKTVPAAKTLEKAEDHDLFTLCVTNISEKDLSAVYTVRPYITYFDASGTKHTVYGNEYRDSLYSAADRLYRSGATNEEEAQKQAVLKSIHENILIKVDTMTNPLANTYRALHNDKKLTIGYLGGSITNGYSASKNGGNINDSFVNRTTIWFENQFPEAKIEAVNAGISDTATNFGVYRLKDHLMNENGHDMPDLVFVEFTVNDWTYDNGISQDGADLSRQIESLVRNIYAANPYTDIVFVFTARSENAVSRKEYVKIAESYGIPYVDMGIPMQKLMSERGHANEAEGNYYYTTDNLHPSGIGYGIYFEQIKALLEENLVNSAVYYPEKRDYAKNMPAQLNRSLWLEPKIIPASEFTLSGTTSKWSGLNSSMFGTSKTAQSSFAVTSDSFFARGEDAAAEFTFEGTSFGLIFGMNSSGFDIDYQIDGHGWKKAQVDEELLSFQKYAHNQIFIFEQELAYGTHKVELKFNPTSDGKVNVQIGGAAVSGVPNGFDKMVALSIDDGPRQVDSNKIMDVLKKHGAHATFFCVGSSINDSTTPTLQRMIAEGHEIGNHGNGWNAMKDMSKTELMKDFNTVQDKVYKAAGVYPKVFRAPGLSVSATMYETLPLPLFGGSLGISDWKPADEVGLDERIKAMRNQMFDGRVILIHDLEVNSQALDTVIPEYHKKGFAIVTISDLIKLRGYSAPANVNFQYTSFPK